MSSSASIEAMRAGGVSAKRGSSDTATIWGLLVGRQRVRRCWPDRVRPLITACRAIVLAPALDDARVDPGKREGSRQARHQHGPR
jgi:hypothetical protein